MIIEGYIYNIVLYNSPNFWISARFQAQLSGSKSRPKQKGVLSGGFGLRSYFGHRSDSEKLIMLRHAVSRLGLQRV